MENCFWKGVRRRRRRREEEEEEHLLFHFLVESNLEEVELSSEFLVVSLKHLNRHRVASTSRLSCRTNEMGKGGGKEGRRRTCGHLINARLESSKGFLLLQDGSLVGGLNLGLGSSERLFQGMVARALRGVGHG